MWRARDFSGLRRRSRAEQKLLIEATLWLGLARCCIRLIPFRWTTRLFALTPGEAAPTADVSSREFVARVGWAVKAAAARTPWQSMCLAQALAGSGMLRARRIPATMAMGVAKSAGEPGALEAHAWLSSGGLVLTGAGGHERFQVVARFTPVLRRRGA
jgi:hypothetical protein